MDKKLKELNDSIESKEEAFDKIIKIFDHEDVRVLLCKSSFALIFPSKIWKNFDSTVKEYLITPLKKCWLFGQNVTIHKINLNDEKFYSNNPDLIDFISKDVEIRKTRTIRYLTNSFLNHSLAFPTDYCYTIDATLNSVPKPSPQQQEQFKPDLLL